MARRLAQVLTELRTAKLDLTMWHEILASIQEAKAYHTPGAVDHRTAAVARLEAEALAMVAAASDATIVRWLGSTDPWVRPFVNLNLHVRPPRRV